MTVLVTGGAGYIGSHAVLALLSRGEKVVIVDNLSTGDREQIVRLKVDLMEEDAGNIGRMRWAIKELGVKAILHFAGSISVEESVRGPLKYYRNNTEVSRRLIEAAVEGGVKCFIFSSSAAVYGMPQKCLVHEEMPLRPANPYGRSKLMVEHMLADVAATCPDFRYAALRYFNVAGADPLGRVGYRLESQPASLIRAALAAALGRTKHFRIFGIDYPTTDGTAVRDYIHVSDLAEAHVCALQYLRQGGKSTSLNCGYETGYSVREVVETVQRVSGRDFSVELAPQRPGDVAQVVADIDRISAALPLWHPKWDDLDEMVRHQLAWEQSQHILPVA